MVTTQRALIDLALSEPLRPKPCWVCISRFHQGASGSDSMSCSGPGECDSRFSRDTLGLAEGASLLVSGCVWWTLNSDLLLVEP